MVNHEAYNRMVMLTMDAGSKRGFERKTSPTMTLKIPAER